MEVFAKNFQKVFKDWEQLLREVMRNDNF